MFVYFAAVPWQVVYMPQFYTAMWKGFMLDEWADPMSTVMELLKKNFTSWSLDTQLGSLYASLRTVARRLRYISFIQIS
jgi:hypothetical protein